jgi:hypothetical protein
MYNQLQKAIDLVKKTGDRLMVFDSANPENIYVVMSLKDYENLILGKSEVRGLTEDELLDKINRDIAIWKSDQDFQEKLAEFKQTGGFDFDNFNKIDYKERKTSPASIWSIPKKIKEGAEEVIEEDRQYLEDINF